MSRYIEKHDLKDYLNDVIQFCEDEKRRTEILDILEAIDIALNQGYRLMAIENLGNNVEFKDDFNFIYAEQAFAYSSNYNGDAYEYRKWMLVKDTEFKDKNGNKIYIDYVTRRGFVINGYGGSPEYFGRKYVILAQI